MDGVVIHLAASLLAESPPRDVSKLRVSFDADAAPAKSRRGEDSGTGTDERVDHKVVWPGAGKDDSLSEGERHLGRMVGSFWAGAAGLLDVGEASPSG